MPVTAKRRPTNPAVYALNLAMLLDGCRLGKTFDEIRASGVLGDESVPEDTVKHRLYRAIDHLAKIGIVITRDDADAPACPSRWRLASDITYAQTTDVSLTGAEAMRLASLIASCLQSGVPFSRDLQDAGRRIMSIARQGDALRSIASVNVPAPAASGEEGFAALAGQARDERRALAFTYCGAAPARPLPTARLVDVYDVRIHLGHAYVVGLDRTRGAVRTFRADRVADAPAPALAGPPRAYEIPTDFDPRDYFRLRFQYPEASRGDATPADGSEDRTLAFRATRPLSARDRARVAQGQGSWGDDGTWVVSSRSDRAAASWAVEAALADDVALEGPQEVLDVMVAGLRRAVTVNG